MYVGADIAAEWGAERCATPDAAPSHCATCPVRASAVCASLTPGALAALHGIGRRRALRKGQTLLWEGDEAPAMINVISGTLKLSRITRAGDEQIVALVGRGGFVGNPLGGVIENRVAAIGESALCIFPAAPFRRFVDAHPAIAMAMLERSLGELDRARRWLGLLGRATAGERVAALLLDLAGNEADEAPHALPLSRSEMADCTGLTIETVSRQLSRLRAAGIVAFPSRCSFELRDRAILTAMAGGAPAHGLH